jgi:hypothetical protein
MTPTLHVEQKTEEDGTEIIAITQPGAAGFKGTQETRRIPSGDEKSWRDHTDHVFGHVKGKFGCHMKMLSHERHSDE